MANLTQTQLQNMAANIGNAMNDLQNLIETNVLADDLPLVGAGLVTGAPKTTAALGVVVADALASLATAGNKADLLVISTLQSALAAAGFTGIGIGISVVGGAATITLATTFAEEFAQSLADDLGLARLNVDSGGTATVDATFVYDLTFGADAGGFFLETGSDAEVTLELAIDQVALTGLTLDGQDFAASDAGTSFDGTLAIDLAVVGGRTNAAGVAAASVAATLSGAASVAIDLAFADPAPLTPALSATLEVDWNFAAATITPGNNNAGFGTTPTVTFREVTMDLGGFMENFLSPLIVQVNDLLDPIRPIIDLLTTRLRVLEDFPGLGGVFDANNDTRVDLLDIIDLLPGTDLTAIRSLIDVVEQITDWAAALEELWFGDGNLILGDFVLQGDIRNANFDLGAAAAEFADLADDLNTVLAGLGGAGWASGGREILQDITGGNVIGLPILTDPDQWIGLFLGQEVDLVTVDLPRVNLTTGAPRLLLPPIPIFPGLQLEVSAAGGLELDFDFGFSSRGLITPGLTALDGLYIVDQDGPEVALTATVELAVALDAFVADITGGGDVTGIINLELINGATADRLYLDEFIAAVEANPFSIFDASGAITLGFFASASIIVIGEVWRWNSPRITLGNFSFDGINDPVDYNLAARTGGSLLLHIGALAAERNGPDDFDHGEIVEIMTDPTGQRLIVVNTLPTGVRRGEFDGIATVRGNGGDFNDSIVLSETLQVAANLGGGRGDDVLSGGARNDTLSGELNDDVLFGWGGRDRLIGGAGDDTLNGGVGQDTLLGGTGNDLASYINSFAGVTIDFDLPIMQGGEAVGDVLTSIEHIDGSAFDDLIKGSQGAGTFSGFTGNDTLISGDHAQLLLGNDGNDVLESFGADDTLVGGTGDDTYVVKNVATIVSENFLGEIRSGSGGYDRVEAWVDLDLRTGGAWIERIDMLGFARNVFGDLGENLIFGTAFDDVIDGYIASDTINGGDGDDTLFGGLGSSGDTLRGEAGDDVLDGGAAGDLLEGGDGNDTLIGGFGADVLDGGAGGDFYIADATDTILEPIIGLGTDLIWAQDDFALAAGLRIEILSLRSLEAGDWQAAYAGVNRPAELDLLARNTGVNGANMNANLTGNALGQVLIASGGGASLLAGLAGADTLIGDAEDTADYTASTAAVTVNLNLLRQLGGDAEGDILRGITRITGSDHGDVIASRVLGFTRETFDGGAGNDTLRGYGGDDTLTGGTGDDLIDGGDGNDSLSADDGRDTVLGGNGNDTIWGLGGDDSLSGGDGDDTLEGHAGDDTMDGGAGNDFFTVLGADVILDSSGHDTILTFVDFVLGGAVEIEVLQAGYTVALAGSLNINLTGSDAHQTLIGNIEDNVLIGLGGADTIDGLTGLDEVSYKDSDFGVNVDLNRSVQLFGDATGDVLISIERVRGSDHDDRLVGKSNREDGDIAPTILWGEDGDDYLADSVGENTLWGGAGDDTLVGSGATAGLAATGSKLYGQLGNDFLDAGASTATGGDTLVGGLGDDRLRVTSAGDVVEELPGEGHDTLIVDVAVWVMNGLQTAIEDVELEGNFNLTANNLANRITGSALANTIRGQGGNDTLLGMDGNDFLLGGNGLDSLDGGTGADRMEGGNQSDIYVVDDVGDTVIEATALALLGGIDLVLASVSFTLGANVENLTLTGQAANATGNALDNHLIGNALANRLDGTTGADTLEGGAGNDVYVTDGNDSIIDTIGIDRVEASVSYVLGAALENLTLTGTADIDGTGNARVNRIIGNAGDNRLDGGAGVNVVDRLQGGAGNDTYVTSGDDIIIEAVNGGIDVVESSGSYTLAGNVENLILTGTGAINGTGNVLNNDITGNSAANVLTGGGGADDFIFATALGTVDEITDFSVFLDRIVLDRAIFAALDPGGLDPTAFHIGANGVAAGLLDRIIYDDVTGALYYNRDGVLSAPPEQFALLESGLALTAGNFFVL